MAIKHCKFQPNEYVLVMKNGKIVNQGLGLSFFHNTLSTSMSVIPVVSFDTSFAFDDITTSDFQRINVQGDISYVIRDYEKVSTLVDFSYINTEDYENKKTEAKQVMGRRIANLAKTSISKYVNEKDVRTVIHSQEQIASYLTDEIVSNQTIKDFGLEIVSVSILAISPQLETKKALEAATREEILQQQDDAIYKRRNASIEQERIVKENELNTEIKVAEKEREKEEKAIAAKMSIQEKNAAAQMQKLNDDTKFNAEKLSAEGKHAAAVRQQKTNAAVAEQKDKITINHATMEQIIDDWSYRTEEKDNIQHETRMRRAEHTKEEQSVVNTQKRESADATAYANQVILKAFESIDKEVLIALLVSNMDSKTLIAKAFGDLAVNADKIGNLNISPDLLDSLTSASGKAKVN